MQNSLHCYSLEEIAFAKLQKLICWFSLDTQEDLPPLSPDVIASSPDFWDNYTLIQRYIFARIFGAFDIPQDIERARSLCFQMLIGHDVKMPKDTSMNNVEYVEWLKISARYNILYGTIMPYMQKYTHAAYHLMNGLRAGVVDLFQPYYDFINYVLSKLQDYPVEVIESEGCGFLPDNPMGSADTTNGFLIPQIANEVIPSLESDKEGILLVYNGKYKVGNVHRRGSTRSEKFAKPIDIYEVLVVCYSGKLKKLRLYFNGYFTREDLSSNPMPIRLPQGYHIEECNRAVVERYKGV